MTHPLTPNLHELSDSDLAEKISTINKRISAAYRFGNPQLLRQAQMMMEDYLDEQQRRQMEQMKKMQEQNDSGKNWDDIIDIS